jgi:hypothetical protein
VPWLEQLVAECSERLAIVLPLRAHELSFLEQLNGAGDIAPEFLTADPALQSIPPGVAGASGGKHSA